MNKDFNSEIIALHQADSDMQKENLVNLKEETITPDQFLEQQAIIGRLFKAGMEEILEKATNTLSG